ncbi:unnamed protein product [Paramecium sonneborni]|uniref:Uncharacterized protein n=1 Tax=Paramecium sonneborni TaxID=65129 RepID=A0A8S1LFY5_9CILI|nr:unnamed protein product [Paramecium sonneborni]
MFVEMELLQELKNVKMEILYNMMEWLELCGDLMIVVSDQFKDGNLQDTDGCKDCKYFCRIGCSSCDYNIHKCLSCELSGFVPKDYYCDNVCGDGLVVIDLSGIQRNVMIVILIIMMVVITFANFNVKHHMLVVYMKDAQYAQMDICLLMKKYVYQYLWRFQDSTW